MPDKNFIFMLDIDTYLEIYELAKSHGKQAGDSMQEEFEEILKKKRDKFKFLGATNDNIDMITGNLREEGLRVLNMKEVERRNNDWKSS